MLTGETPGPQPGRLLYYGSNELLVVGRVKRF